MAEIQEKQRFNLKHHPAADQPYFPNLIGEEWEEAMLKQDLDRRSTVKELIPHRHVVHQVIAHFRGESYHKLTAEDINSALERLGLTKNHQINQIPAWQHNQTLLCISKRGRPAVHADEAALAGRRRRDDQSLLVIIVTKIPTNRMNFAQLLM